VDSWPPIEIFFWFGSTLSVGSADPHLQHFELVFDGGWAPLVLLLLLLVTCWDNGG